MHPNFDASLTMTFNPESKYPTRRAYVLKLTNEAKPDSLTGRLENLVTGRQRQFTSGDELLASLASDVDTTVPDPQVE